jgi:hypothetical protein
MRPLAKRAISVSSPRTGINFRTDVLSVVAVGDDRGGFGGFGAILILLLCGCMPLLFVMGLMLPVERGWLSLATV